MNFIKVAAIAAALVVSGSALAGQIYQGGHGSSGGHGNYGDTNQGLTVTQLGKFNGANVNQS